MKDFFISYNREDRKWAKWIAWQLEEAAYKVVIQAWDFRPGVYLRAGNPGRRGQDPNRYGICLPASGRVHPHVVVSRPLHGHILLTTRARAAGAMARPVEIQKKPTEDGALLVLRRARYIAEDAALERPESRPGDERYCGATRWASSRS